MTLTKAQVVVGQICAPYGVKGWLHVRSFTDPASNLAKFIDWQLYCKAEKHSKEFKIEQIRPHADHFVAKLIGIADRDAAAALTNWHIAVDRESLPALPVGEYYLADLLGMTVHNSAGIVLGNVVDFLATGAHDILVIKGEKEYLIPYVPGEHILAVCLAKQEIQVAWDAEL